MKLNQISALFAAIIISTGAAACGCKGGSKPSRPPAPSPAPTPTASPAPSPSPSQAPAPRAPSGSSSTYTGGTSSLPPSHPLTWPDPVPPAPAQPASSSPRPEPEVIFVPVVVEVPAEPVVIVMSTAYAVPGPERIVYVERSLCDAVRTPPKPAIQVTKRKPAPKACK